MAADELVDDRDRSAPAESAGTTIGWQGRETLGDTAHGFFYAQRTADDRIAIGGRGVPYRFGSRTDRDGAVSEATIAPPAAVS